MGSFLCDRSRCYWCRSFFSLHCAPHCLFPCSPYSALSDPLLSVGLCCKARPSFPPAGCSLRGRLGQEELLASKVGGCLGRWPGGLTCQVGSGKGSSLVASASFPLCGGWRPQQSLPGRYSQDTLASLGTQYTQATKFVPHQQGWLFSCHSVAEIHKKLLESAPFFVDWLINILVGLGLTLKGGSLGSFLGQIYADGTGSGVSM